MPYIIDDQTIIEGPPPGLSKGLERRDFSAFPVGYVKAAPPWDIPLLSDQEILEGIKRQNEEQSSLWHVRERGNNGQRIPALDQNGQGYCWAYSTTSVCMLLRVAAGLPYVRLSGHMIGCLVKGYRDQGGWNAVSAEFAAEHGIASVEKWAEKSMSRSNDTPEMRADAKRHMNFEYMELDDGGPNLPRQMATAYLKGWGLMKDQNFWSHSIMGLRIVDWKPGTQYPLTDDILNSWTDRWGENGVGRQTGSRALAQGCIAIRAVSPSMT